MTLLLENLQPINASIGFMLNTAAQILTSGAYGILLGEMVDPMWALGALLICIGTYLVQNEDQKDKKA